MRYYEIDIERHRKISQDINAIVQRPQLQNRTTREICSFEELEEQQLPVKLQMEEPEEFQDAVEAGKDGIKDGIKDG